MGKRNFYFQIERAARKEAKIVRDEKKKKRLAKGPTLGAKLAAKMAGRSV